MDADPEDESQVRQELQAEGPAQGTRDEEGWVSVGDRADGGNPTRHHARPIANDGNGEDNADEVVDDEEDDEETANAHVADLDEEEVNLPGMDDNAGSVVLETHLCRSDQGHEDEDEDEDVDEDDEENEDGGPEAGQDAEESAIAASAAASGQASRFRSYAVHLVGTPDARERILQALDGSDLTWRTPLVPRQVHLYAQPEDSCDSFYTERAGDFEDLARSSSLRAVLKFYDGVDCAETSDGYRFDMAILVHTCPMENATGAFSAQAQAACDCKPLGPDAVPPGWARAVMHLPMTSCCTSSAASADAAADALADRLLMAVEMDGATTVWSQGSYKEAPAASVPCDDAANMIFTLAVLVSAIMALTGSLCSGLMGFAALAATQALATSSLKMQRICFLTIGLHLAVFAAQHGFQPQQHLPLQWHLGARPFGIPRGEAAVGADGSGRGAGSAIASRAEQASREVSPRWQTVSRMQYSLVGTRPVLSETQRADLPKSVLAWERQWHLHENELESRAGALQEEVSHLRHYLVESLHRCGWWCEDTKLEMGEQRGWWFQEDLDNPHILFLDPAN